MHLEAAFAITGLLGLLFLIWGTRRIWRRSFIIGGAQGITGALLVAVASALFALLSNFYIYHRLSAEQPLAEFHFEALGPQYYRAVIRYPTGEQRIFDVRGDEWQLDARILKWRGYATLIGFDTAYRLDRFSGRYRKLEQERHGERTVYSLSGDPMLDLWTLARRYQGSLPWIDTLYGSAAYMPLADKAAYAVSVTNSGLIARPLNESARGATEQWH